MKKTFLSIVLITSLFFLNHCGFKVVKYGEDKNYNVINFEDVGNSNINYTIQRNLVRTHNNQNLFDLDISIESILNKNIKEKDISNKVTKYELIVVSKVKILVIDKNKEYEFSISDKGELKASNKINKLRYDENIILLRLANNISNQIDRKITSLLNDL